MATFVGLPAFQTQILFHCSSHAFISPPLHFKPSQDTESEAETTSVQSSSTSLSSSNSTYNWRAGIGAIGLVETAYLTYLKLFGYDAFYPLGGGSCGDVLNSDYAIIFGVPLPLLGLAAYGFVTTLSLQLSAKNLPLGISETNGRLLLLRSTTSMAAASGYLLYTLSTKFAGTPCSYCLMSALLSFRIFFISLKDVGFTGMNSKLGDCHFKYLVQQFTICVVKMFGAEAAKLLDYVECFPDGFKIGNKMIKACVDAKLEGFPTWVINGQVMSGEMELRELAEASEFNFNE